MTAREKLLQLTNKGGSQRALSHFKSITNNIIFFKVAKGNLEQLTTNANLLVDNEFNGNLEQLTTNANLLVDNEFNGNLENIDLRGDFNE